LFRVIVNNDVLISVHLGTGPTQGSIMDRDDVKKILEAVLEDNLMIISLGLGSRLTYKSQNSLRRNLEINARTVSNWGRLCIFIHFFRANQSHPYRNSIHDILFPILSYAGLTLSNPAPQKPTSAPSTPISWSFNPMNYYDYEALFLSAADFKNSVTLKDLLINLNEFSKTKFFQDPIRPSSPANQERMDVASKKRKRI